MNGYNPFSLIQGILNKQTIYLRPIQFDDCDYDKEFKKSNGELIRPTMATTTCPKCSCVIEQHVPKNFDLLNDVLNINCIKCNPIINNIFPFDDPFNLLKISIININPSAITDVRLNQKCSKEPLTPIKEDVSKLDKLFKPDKQMGLGEFIKNKTAWNKLKHQLDTNFVTKQQDIFDVFASIPENQPQSKTEEL